MDKGYGSPYSGGLFYPSLQPHRYTKRRVRYVLPKALKIERYKDFKPTSDEERLETDAFGNTQADLVAKIRRWEGEEYYQRNKHYFLKSWKNL